MKIRFLQDFRGKLTGEKFYPAGSVVELENSKQLVAAGRAEFVTEAEPVLAADLDGLTLNELKAMGRDAGVPYYYRLSRQQLIAHLRDD